MCPLGCEHSIVSCRSPKQVQNNTDINTTIATKNCKTTIATVYCFAYCLLCFIKGCPLSLWYSFLISLHTLWSPLICGTLWSKKKMSDLFFLQRDIPYQAFVFREGCELSRAPHSALRIPQRPSQSRLYWVLLSEAGPKRQVDQAKDINPPWEPTLYKITCFWLLKSGGSCCKIARYCKKTRCCKIACVCDSCKAILV